MKKLFLPLLALWAYGYHLQAMEGREAYSEEKGTKAERQAVEKWRDLMKGSNFDTWLQEDPQGEATICHLVSYISKNPESDAAQFKDSLSHLLEDVCGIRKNAMVDRWKELVRRPINESINWFKLNPQSTGTLSHLLRFIEENPEYDSAEHRAIVEDLLKTPKEKGKDLLNLLNQLYQATSNLLRCEDVKDIKDKILNLINNGADVNLVFYWGGCLHFTGSFSKHLEIFDALIEAGADVNMRPYDSQITPLHQAVSVGSLSVVQALLKAGANPNIKNNKGKTPLHEPYASGRIVQELLNAKADPNITDYDGCTPLHITKIVETIEPLMRAGAPLEAKDKRNASPLKRAILFNKDSEIIRELIRVGCNPYVINSDKETLLHTAAFQRVASKQENIKVLLEAGIDPRVKNNENETALDMVKSPMNESPFESDNLEAIELLENAVKEWNKGNFPRGI